MKTSRVTEFIHEGRKLEAARAALRHGDLDAARRLGKVYEMTPVKAA